MQGLEIIVVNYRTSNDLQHFLLSLKRNPPAVPYALTVVNVDPRSDDIEVVATSGCVADSFRHITHEENVGYARAVNHAAVGGRHEVLAIFNADTRLTDGLATDCYYALLSNPEWGILGPRQTDNEGKITHAGMFGPHREERGFLHRNSPMYGDVRDDAVTVSGSAYFIRRSLWEELTECPIYRRSVPESTGAFLPTPHYYEDTFCSYHARAHGQKVVYYGPATMIHLWHRSCSRVEAGKKSKVSRQLFREACDAHGIEHD